jgi:2-dehydro-3-deoxyphosphooctonate aldolase (KDO 8-P synthase)
VAGAFYRARFVNEHPILHRLFQPQPHSFFLIAGPCVIESAEVCLAVAREVKTVCESLGIAVVFKASFDKANRSSGSSFRGPGLTDGLAVLHRIRDELDLPVLTDFHECAQVVEAGSTLDVIQIPAFLARQTDLLIAAAHTGRAVNVKKGQFMAPQEMGNAVEKLRAAGAKRVLLTERGTFFGYGRLVNDFGSLPVLQSFGCPTVFDATHSTQKPAGMGTSSGGDPSLTPLLARAAVAAGFDGLFLECHPDPTHARSDATSMIRLDSLGKLLESCMAIARAR